jgi:hypothetical protein
MVIASVLHEAIPAQDDEIASQRALAKTDIAVIFAIAGRHLLEVECLQIGAELVT